METVKGKTKQQFFTSPETKNLIHQTMQLTRGGGKILFWQVLMVT